MSYELNAGGKQLAEVIEKVTWSGDSKQVARKLVFTEANYKTSLQNMVDRVLITDKDGNQIGVVEDTAAQQKYGVVQTVYKQEDGKDAQTEAKALLQTLEQTGSVTGCPGDSRAVSGYALIVQETTTGLFGKFYIESDTHTFTDGKHEMALTLAFSNMMDEKEIENQS